MKIIEGPSKQFLIFIFGGLLSALIDVGTLILLIKIDTTVFIATTGGFFLGLLFNYLFHTQVTFSVPKTIRSLYCFVIIVGVNYIITLVFVFAAQFLNMHAVIGKLVSLPFVALNGFYLSKYWAFK
jgi:putative flippase GtrA